MNLEYRATAYAEKLIREGILSKTEIIKQLRALTDWDLRTAMRVYNTAEANVRKE